MSVRKLRIALYGNIYQESKAVAVERFLEAISKRGAALIIPEQFYNFLSKKLDISVPHCEVVSGYNFDADIVVCMGGDGTFLDAASKVGVRETPILGINTGRLGFLASFSPETIDEAVEDLYTDNYSIERHSVLNISCDELELEGYPYALNEISILKHDISSMISIHTYINNEYLTTYLADGLIVGTPTGSTAYSLSVGGPIIEPLCDTITLTPVAPHSLNMRPIVIRDTSVITLCVESRSHNFLISLDGRSRSYRENIHLRIRKAPYAVKVVTHKDQSFFTTLRKKMMWGADSREE